MTTPDHKEWLQIASAKFAKDVDNAIRISQLVGCRLTTPQLAFGSRLFTRSVCIAASIDTLSNTGTIVYPGNFGAFNWGGVAVDTARQLIVATPDGQTTQSDFPQNSPKANAVWGN